MGRTTIPRTGWRRGEVMVVGLQGGETAAAAGIFSSPEGCRGRATMGTLSAAACHSHSHSADLHCRAIGSTLPAPAATALPRHPAGYHLLAPETEALSSPSLGLIDRLSCSCSEPSALGSTRLQHPQKLFPINHPESFPSGANIQQRFRDSLTKPPEYSHIKCNQRSVALDECPVPSASAGTQHLIGQGDGGSKCPSGSNLRYVTRT